MGGKKLQKNIFYDATKILFPNYIRHFHTRKKQRYTSGYARENGILFFSPTFDDFPN